MPPIHFGLRWFGGVLGLLLAFDASWATAARELIRDPHFQNGFYLLEPKPGKREAYGAVKGLAPGKPVWDLAQWSSSFPLHTNDLWTSNEVTIYSNRAKEVIVSRPGSDKADLSLGVNAGTEYPQPRTSPSQPWVHLLVQQELKDPPALGELAACEFHLETRLKHSRLVNTNGYSPSLHAAQFLVYLTVANCNSNAAGYHECFWFGIPIYDNRAPHAPAYEAQDFGQTKLFIFTPGSDTFAERSTHEREWVTFEKDLLPLIQQGLEHAQAKGFIKDSAALRDYRPLGIFIGWEVPGVFDVELQIRNLSLRARSREP